MNDQSIPNESAQLPTHNETIRKDILSTCPAAGTRRVKRWYRRVISEPADITYIQPDDILVRLHTETGITDTIDSIGPHLSPTDGMHVRTTSGNIIHLNLVRQWMSDDRAYIAGIRSSESTELEGVDFEPQRSTA